MTTNGAPNGTHPDPAALMGTFDFEKWRRLTELAIAEGEKRLAQAREAIAEARDAVEKRERELDVLRRALSLEVLPHVPHVPHALDGAAVVSPLPPPPTPSGGAGPAVLVPAGLPPPPEIGRAVRDGKGTGYRAGMYLLEVIRLRGDGTLSYRQAVLACNTWSAKTVQDGLTRLVRDGLVERYDKGAYRLTEAGCDLCADGPVPAVLLPLSDPGREEAEEKFSAREPRPVAPWAQELVQREEGPDPEAAAKARASRRMLPVEAPEDALARR